MFDTYLAVDGQTDIFDHLSSVQFSHQHTFHFFCVCSNSFGWEGPKGDRTQDADLDAFFAGQFHCFLSDTGHGAEGYDEIVGVFAVDFFETDFVLLYLAVFCLEADIVLLHFFGLQFERGDDVGLASFRLAGSGPRALGDDFCVGAARLGGREHHFLHHLSDDAVGQDDGRIAVFEGQFEGKANEVGHFLYRGRSQGDEAVVTVSATFYGLEIVGLAGLDGSQAGTSAHDVYDEAGQFGTGQIGDAFLFQADTGAGRRGHHHFSASGTAVHHIDCGHFAFGLQHHHAGGFPRLQLGQSFQYFRLGSNRVTEVSVGSAADSGVCDGFVTFH